MGDFHTIGGQFCEHYYKTFSENRQDLADLYTDDSMLTHEGKPFKGLQNIIQHLTDLPQIKHNIDTFDAQPTVNDGILCMINGDMYIENEQNPLKFAQTFHLQKGGKLDYFCLNDFFRVNCG